jgi:hypothetical protein
MTAQPSCPAKRRVGVRIRSDAEAKLDNSLRASSFRVCGRTWPQGRRAGGVEGPGAELLRRMGGGWLGADRGGAAWPVDSRRPADPNGPCWAGPRRRAAAREADTALARRPLAGGGYLQQGPGRIRASGYSARAARQGALGPGAGHEAGARGQGRGDASRVFLSCPLTRESPHTSSCPPGDRRTHAGDPSHEGAPTRQRDEPP